MNNIYKEYNFKFDKKVYAKNFSSFVRNKYPKPTDFYEAFGDLKKQYEIDLSYSIETLKSYYYGRLTPSLDILHLMTKRNAELIQDLYLPNSRFEYSNIYINEQNWQWLFSCFMETFHPYNDSIYEILEYKQECEKDSDNNKEDYFDCYCTEALQAGKFISRFNYLIQKYVKSSICDDEKEEIDSFYDRYIESYINKEKNFELFYKNLKEIYNLDNNNFIINFYKSYYVSYFGLNCISLLLIFQEIANDKLRESFLTLLSDEDKNMVLYFYYNFKDENLYNFVKIIEKNIKYNPDIDLTKATLLYNDYINLRKEKTVNNGNITK